MKICIYGAGKLAERYLPIIKNKYEIQYIMDLAKEKHGSRLCGFLIVAPTIETVNKYPVLVLLSDIRSGYGTLKSLLCQQRTYGVMEYAGGIGLYRIDREESMKETLEKCFQIQNEQSDFSKIKVGFTKQVYNSEKPRYFDIASPIDFDATGGPCACLRNLYLANEEYNGIENFYTVCPSTAWIPLRAPIIKSLRCNSEINSNFDVIRANNAVNPFASCVKTYSIEAVRLYFYIVSLCDFLKKVDAVFQFNKNDIFLLQDPYIVQVFIHMFPDFTRVIAANHTQGTLRSEMGKKAPELGAIFDMMQAEHLRRIKNWIFPSKGAVEGFLATASKEMKQEAKSVHFNIAYNGYERKEQIAPDEKFVKEMDDINFADIVFASATYLYKNKGVERIPEILADFKYQTGLKIKWVLVGSGEMEAEVQVNIQKYLDESDYIWYRRRFENQDNIFELFRRSDFYIMMHRVSVFDLSTLQAMSYGCVPMLSDVGGNKELCAYDNGVLINDSKLDLLDFMKGCVWNTEILEDKKKLNKRIVDKKFNNKAFLDGYRKQLYRL